MKRALKRVTIEVDMDFTSPIYKNWLWDELFVNLNVWLPTLLPWIIFKNNFKLITKLSIASSKIITITTTKNSR